VVSVGESISSLLGAVAFATLSSNILSASLGETGAAGGAILYPGSEASAAVPTRLNIIRIKTRESLPSAIVRNGFFNVFIFKLPILVFALKLTGISKTN
jgi:hypothetical protein